MWPQLAAWPRGGLLWPARGPLPAESGPPRQRWGRLPSEWKPAPTTMGRPPPGGRARVAIRSGSGGGRAGPVIQQSLCASRPSYQPVTHRRRRLRHLTHAAGRWAVTSRVRAETLRAFFDLGKGFVAAAGGTRGLAAGRLWISNFGVAGPVCGRAGRWPPWDARHPARTSRTLVIAS